MTKLQPTIKNVYIRYDELTSMGNYVTKNLVMELPMYFSITKTAQSDLFLNDEYILKSRITIDGILIYPEGIENSDEEDMS